MSNVRVTYSGFIAFIVSLVGLVTGIIFVVMVTRKLTPEELGIWTLIGSMVGYVLIVEPVISTWTTRQIARGEKVGKTAIFTSGLFSVGGFTVYGIIVTVVAYSLGVDWFILLLSMALIPLNFLTQTLSAIAHGFKPQGLSYGLLIFETSKVPLGVIFVVLIQLGVIGALITTIIASLLRLILLVLVCKQEIIGVIKRNVIKFWLGMSWLTIYSTASDLIRSSTVLIFSLITGSLIGLAYWGVATTISGKISIAGTISQGLYPKLLATGRKQFAEENLKRTMYFAIPFLGWSIVLAHPTLHILNPIYVDGFLIVIILSIRSFVYILLDFYFNIIRAFETIDIDKQINFKKYMKSKLFLLPTLHYIQFGAYAIILIIFLISIDISNKSDVSLVTWWAFIYFVVTIPITVYVMILGKKQHNINLPYYAIAKYSIATLVSASFMFVITKNFLTYSQSIWDFLPQFIPMVLFGCGVYFGLTYIIDNDTRILLKSIINEIKRK